MCGHDSKHSGCNSRLLLHWFGFQIGAVPEAPLLTRASGGLSPSGDPLCKPLVTYKPLRFASEHQRLLMEVSEGHSEGPAEACRVGHQAGRGLQHHQRCHNPKDEVGHGAESFGHPWATSPASFIASFHRIITLTLMSWTYSLV